MTTQRPTAVTVAAILLALLSLLNLVPPSLILTPAQAAEIPTSAVYLFAVLAIVGLVAAYGLWTLKRWGLWLAIIISVPNILLAVPGMLFATTATLQILTIASVVGFALIIALVMLPASRRACA